MLGKMILRVLTLVKHILLTILRITCTILRCGRRKKAPVDDSLPTDIIIGDNQASFQKYPPNSTISNGYEVSQPSYYDTAIAQHQKYPYQSQALAPTQMPSTYVNDDEEGVQMEAWEQWGYEDSSLQMGEHNQTQNKSIEQNNIQDEEEDINFFTDMEPSVKVKKIFVKKKSRTNSERKNRLAVNNDLDFVTTSELDSWQDQEDEVNGGGWMDEDVDIDDIDTAKIVREARELKKKERLQKSEQQKKSKLAKKPSHHHDHKLATKVS